MEESPRIYVDPDRKPCEPGCNCCLSLEKLQELHRKYKQSFDDVSIIVNYPIKNKTKGFRRRRRK